MTRLIPDRIIRGSIVKIVLQDDSQVIRGLVGQTQTGSQGIFTDIHCARAGPGRAFKSELS